LARLTFAPLDDFRISTGLRYTDDRKTFDGTSKILIDACNGRCVPGSAAHSGSEQFRNQRPRN